MTLPLIIVLVFFAVTFLIGIIDRKKVTIEDYWVNGRKTNKFVLVVKGTPFLNTQYLREFFVSPA